ncbi:TIGR04282 family arsenosugar biosynthesis glycosyltransferase [Cesiribacter andamanensis]|uniref:Transferase 1, rSAM/selenodomain-associated n=1 Tax=Cesiribacter andamanensis AMV16 TaxID=1279009 RepID=M7N0K8_9BACT|nr:TIGR04282 family arsenosugar biosynthesis glycosyltransferase [Cesiribacter andamanensis]EMR00832.1 transferase 1, rSAM/selenodomain-associated [Cesiribacter andamanensis AMV16]
MELSNRINMTPTHLIIFVKNRIPGQTKTRLAASLGHEAALQVYDQLLAHTHAVTAPLPCSKWVFFSDYLEEEGLWERGYRLEVQQGGDLGERMYRAFEHCFSEGAQRVCIIGSDCFELEIHHLQQAFEALKQQDVVLGPAADGGYYLLGLQEQQPELFHNKVWSTPDVLADALQDCRGLGLSVHQLPLLHDLDDLQDYKRYQQRLQKS